MKLTLENLALKLNGDIVGDSEIKLNNIAKIEYAKKGDITFLSNKKAGESKITFDFSATNIQHGLIVTGFVLQNRTN